MVLQADDVNDDFYEIYVSANGQPADFIEFLRDDLTMQTIPESEDWALGTFQFTITLEDFAGNRADYAMLFEVDCPTGNLHPLCY